MRRRLPRLHLRRRLAALHECRSRGEDPKRRPRAIESAEARRRLPQRVARADARRGVARDARSHPAPRHRARRRHTRPRRPGDQDAARQRRAPRHDGACKRVVAALRHLQRPPRRRDGAALRLVAPDAVRAGEALLPLRRHHAGERCRRDQHRASRRDRSRERRRVVAGRERPREDRATLRTGAAMSASLPDRRGYYGEFGGKYVPETLMAALDEFESAYAKLRRGAEVKRELSDVLRDLVGRPTPLTEARRFGEMCGGIRLFLKREDLNHTGAHKINNALGQALIAKRMGKQRIIAETGAGQHGVATATACALLGLDCVVYMGEVDMARQELNVFRMRLLGAEVVPVSTGSRTLKDAINEALRDWVTNVRDTHYIIGSVLGPHPFPMIVRDFQSVIGREALEQLRKRAKKKPDVAVACVGGGSNSIGLFYEMLPHKSIRLIGVEAGGRGHNLGEHAARFSGGALGVLHGTRSMVLQDEFGQIAETHSISAGLDYP